MKNFTYKGWKVNGFVMLLVDLLMWGGVAYLGYYLSTPEANLALGITALVVLAIAATVTLAGFMMLEPNESRVLVFFGKYRGTFYETGFWWVNPFIVACAQP